ncbi:MAG: TonB-dependent receptor [Saprospiraceae bacterium]|nr:TonB-dependent receptor [Saprospiraceae bacterium]
MVLCLGLTSVMGQTQLDGQEVEVIKNFDARLADARKLRVRPQLPELDTTVRTYSYRVSVDHPAMSYPAPSIRPLAIRLEEPQRGYQGLIRAGYGIPNAVLFDGSYFFNPADGLEMGVGVRHHSANDTDTPFKHYIDNDVSVTGSYFSSPSLSVSGDLSYSFDNYYLYGVDPADLRLYIDNGRKYNTFKGRVEIGNNERLTGDVNYHAGISVYNHKDNQAARENGFQLDVLGEKWISTKTPVSLRIITDFSTLKDTTKRDLHNFFLQPAVSLRDQRYKVQIGMNIAASNDEFFFFPQVEASVKIAGNQLIAFAGAEGSLRKNNFLSLSTYNPYISERLTDIRNTRYTKYFGGFKGRLKVFEYEGRVNVSDTKDLALFLTDPADSRKFQPVYDDGTVVRVEGVLRAQPMDELEVGAVGSWLHYDLDEQEKAWHLPELQFRIYANYLTSDGRLQLKADLFVADGVPYLNDDDEVVNLNALFDVSLGADYFITDAIGIFARVNNLADNNRQRWLRYDSFGLNAIGGVLVRL